MWSINACMQSCVCHQYLPALPVCTLCHLLVMSILHLICCSVANECSSSSLKSKNLFKTVLKTEFICLIYLSACLHVFNFCPLSSPLGTLCGHIIPPIMVSARNTISVTFQSDSRLTDRGFSAKWEAVYPEDIAGTKTLIYRQNLIWVFLKERRQCELKTQVTVQCDS